MFNESEEADMLQDAVALVTGSSRGIGRATAVTLARAGANLVVSARTAAALAPVTAEIETLGVECLPVAADVTSPESVRELFALAFGHFRHIDVLINNAGTGVYGPVEHVTVEDWNRVIDTNLRGPFLCMREALPIMRRQGSGHIVNVASQAGLYGMPNLGPYCASKFGLVGLSQSVGRELRSTGVRVSYLCPGWVDTAFLDVFPSERIEKAEKASPQRVADEILGLIEDRGHDTGQESLLPRISGFVTRHFFGEAPPHSWTSR